MRISCPICGRTIKYNDVRLSEEDSNYHKVCYDNKYHKFITIGMDDGAYTNNEWDCLTYGYIKFGMGMPNPVWSRITQQIRNFEKEGYTHKGIYYALVYYYEVCNGDVSKANGGIGIVPYIYQDSVKYWCEEYDRYKKMQDKMSIVQIQQKIDNQILLEKKDKKQRRRKSFMEAFDE